MNNTIKLIALDLDGTLNNDQKVITASTKEALLEAQQKGICLALISGRPAAGLSRECHALELAKYNGLLVSYNGAKIADAKSKTILYEKKIPNKMARDLLKHLQQFPVSVMVTDDVSLYAEDENGYKVKSEAANNQLLVQEVPDLAKAITFEPVKVLIAAPNEVLLAHQNAISEPFKEQLSFAISAPFYLEVTMKDISKGSAINHICQVMNIEANAIMAFGDAQNDVPMLKAAGWGVAMGNACDDVKAIADEVTASNNEDGIAKTLRKHKICA